MDPDVDKAIKEQSERHHKALSNIEGRFHSIDIKIDEVLSSLVGTFHAPGLVHRVSAIETAQKVSIENARKLWWMERATKIVDALLVALVILILAAGAKTVIRDVVKEGLADVKMIDDLAKKRPKQCDDCAVVGGL